MSYLERTGDIELLKFRKIKKTRKQHSCDACKKEISAGSQAFVSMVAFKTASGRSAQTLYICNDCGSGKITGVSVHGIGKESKHDNI